MSSIDNRVVQMEFENEQFEKGVETSSKSLKNFESLLNGINGTAGLEAVQKAINSINVESVTSKIDDLTYSFSFLQEIGVGALREIGSKAADTLMSLTKSLTVDQVSEGFNKYTKITESMLAIKNATGKSTEEIQKYIDQLAWYADMTSFDLASMVDALKAYAVGTTDLDFDKTVKNIMGIGNSITYAGQNAKVGSAAFNIWSKAAGEGTHIALMQWQQLERTWKVTSTTLKQDILDAAVAVGTLTKNSKGIYKTSKNLGKQTEVTIGNFQTTLQKKWLTNEVVAKVFGEKYGDYTQKLAAYALEIKNTTGEVLTLTEARDRYESVLRANGVAEDEIGWKMLQSATVAKTYAEAIDAVKDAASSQFRTMFEAMFGNVDEAMVLWTEFSDFLNGLFVTPLAMTASLMTEWKKLGGRTQFIIAIKNLWGVVDAIATPISDAFHEIFEPLSADTLYDITKRFKEFVETLIIGNSIGDKIKNVAKNVFSVFKDGLSIVFKMMNIAFEVVKAVAPIGGVLLEIAYTVEQVIASIVGAVPITKIITSYLTVVLNVVKAAGSVISDVATRVIGWIEVIQSKLIDFVEVAKSIFGPKLRKAIQPMIMAFYLLNDTLSKLGDALMKKIGPFLTNTFKTLLGMSDEFESIGAFALEGLAKGFEIGIGNLLNKIGWLAFNIISKVREILGIHSPSTEFMKIAEFCLMGFSEGLAKGFSIAVTAINALLISVLDTMTSFIDSFVVVAGKFVTSIATGITTLIPVLLDAVMNCIDSVVNWLENGGSDRILNALKHVGEIILAFVLATMPLTIKSIGDGLANVMNNNPITAGGGLINQIKATFKTLQDAFARFKKDKLADIAKSLGIALVALAAAMWVISKIPAENLRDSFLAVTGGITELVIATDFLGNSEGVSKGTMGAIIAMALSMAIVAWALAKIANVPAEDLIRAGVMLGIILVLAEQLISAASKLSVTGKQLGSFAKAMGSIGRALISLSIGLLIFSFAAKILSSMSMDDMANAAIGISLIAGFVALLAIVVKTFDSEGLAHLSGVLLSISASLFIFAIAAKMLANVEMSKALTALAALTLVIGLFYSVVDSTKNKDSIMQLATAMVVMSAALIVFAIACKALEGVKWESIAKAGVALAALIGGIVLLTIVASVVAPILPILMDFAKVVALLGAGVMLAALGISLFVTELEVLSVIGAAKLLAALAAIDLLLVGIVGLAPSLKKLVVMLIEILVDAFLESTDRLVKGLLELIVMLCELLVDATPIVINALNFLLDAILIFLEVGILKIVAVILDTLTRVLDMLTDWVEKDFFSWVNRTLKMLVDQTVISLALLVVDLANGFIDFLVMVFDGISDVIESRNGEVNAALTRLIETIVNNLDDSTVMLLVIGRDIVLNIIKGIGNFLVNLKAKAIEIWDTVKDTAKNLYKDFVEKGKDIVQGIIDGIGELADKVKEAAKGIWQKIAGTFDAEADINSPSKEMFKRGGYIVAGLANGIEDNASGAVKATKGMAKAILDAASDIDLMDNANEIVITPVLDLSQIQQDSKALSSLLSNNTDVTLSSITGNLKSSSEIQNGASGQPAGASFNFTQNNYSPKALSRTEIYRQTRNQFAAFRGRVNNT